MTKDSKHMKRYAAPRSWSITRKEHVWAVKPLPGPHSKEQSIPLMVALRDILHLGRTSAEVRKILGRREVLVDGKVRINYKHVVGLMDVISVPKIDRHFRVLLDPRGRISLKSIDASQSIWKLARIMDKTKIKGGKTQLNLHDGRNMIVEKDTYRTGDVLKISLPDQKVISKVDFKEDSLAMLTGGAHIGTICRVKKIETTKNPMPNIVEFHEGFNTIVDYVFMVGSDRSEIEAAEVSVL
ncbi:MAG: 30S ribosomal protein S4e [Candidatus Thermoplasmatota archaeon]|nr:30S ribosomal protein S4e [Candidatus Thermoplasmatota archaeon]